MIDILINSTETLECIIFLSVEHLKHEIIYILLAKQKTHIYVKACGKCLRCLCAMLPRECDLVQPRKD